MSTACYIPRNFSPETRKIISQANTICAEFQAQGFMVTLRQLYYQFVSRDIIPNKDSEYKRLGSIINDGRLAGMIDWGYMEDRTRNLQGNAHWESPQEIMNIVARQYRNELWDSQDVRPEIWVEKEALAGVIERTAKALDTDYFSCRGYVSQSEMYSAAQRLRSYLDAGQRVVIVHLGDHDPSGIDMTRDIRERLSMFVCRPHHWQWFQEAAREEYGIDAVDLEDNDADDLWATRVADDDAPRPRVEVNRVALNMEQVRRFNPPPNPAKLTDARATSYIRNYGNQSWELDALNPATLDRIIREAIEPLRDDDRWSEAVGKQERDRHHLTTASRNWPDVTAHLDGEYGEFNGGQASD